MIYVREPQKLKEALTSNGNTITSVAKELGCSKAYISSIVTGVRNPNAKIAVGICELTGKQFNAFFYIQSVHKTITKTTTWYKKTYKLNTLQPHRREEYGIWQSRT